tara:strand:- start:10934 stop:12229 length:1296 start_codon:yes stop_codon:yes gene_type:complete
MKIGKFLLVIFFTLMLTSFSLAFLSIGSENSDSECADTTYIGIFNPNDEDTVSGIIPVEVAYNTTDPACDPEEIDFVLEDSGGLVLPFGYYYAEQPYIIDLYTTAFEDGVYEMSAIALYESFLPLSSFPITITINNDGAVPEPPPGEQSEVAFTNFFPEDNALISTDNVELLINFTSDSELTWAQLTITDPLGAETFFEDPTVVIDNEAGTITYQINNLIDGDYSIFLAVENLLNGATNQTGGFTVGPEPEPPAENTAITFTDFSPAEGATITTDSVEILVNFTSDPPLQLTLVSIEDPSLNEILHSQPEVIVNENPGVLTYQATNLVDGNYKVLVTLENEAATLETLSWEFNVDLAPEEAAGIISVFPENGSTITTDSVELLVNYNEQTPIISLQYLITTPDNNSILVGFPGEVNNLTPNEITYTLESLV